MTRLNLSIFSTLFMVFSFCNINTPAPSNEPTGSTRSALTFTCPSGPNQAECQALVRLYTLPTVTPKSPAPFGWLVLDDICRWEGISCTTGPSGLHVTAIDLPFQVRDLPPFAFDGLSYLVTLTIGNKTNVETIQKGTFSGLSSLDALFISSKKLEILTEDIFQGLDNLTLLSLYDSGVKKIDIDSFRGLYHLQALDLGALSGVDRLEVGVFEDLTHLTKLNLGGMSLSSLPLGLFKNLDSLDTLSLVSNRLSGPLADGTFLGLDHLTHLRLINNRGLTGTALPRELCVFWSKGLLIDDSGNKLNRSCIFTPPPVVL